MAMNPAPWMNKRTLSRLWKRGVHGRGIMQRKENQVSSGTLCKGMFVALSLDNAVEEAKEYIYLPGAQFDFSTWDSVCAVWSWAERERERGIEKCPQIYNIQYTYIRVERLSLHLESKIRRSEKGKKDERKIFLSAPANVMTMTQTSLHGQREESLSLSCGCAGMARGANTKGVVERKKRWIIRCVRVYIFGLQAAAS